MAFQHAPHLHLHYHAKTTTQLWKKNVDKWIIFTVFGKVKIFGSNITLGPIYFLHHQKHTVVWKRLKTGGFCDTKLICAWNIDNYQQHQPVNISISRAGALLWAGVYVETALLLRAHTADAVWRATTVLHEHSHKAFVWFNDGNRLTCVHQLLCRCSLSTYFSPSIFPPIVIPPLHPPLHLLIE